MMMISGLRTEYSMMRSIIFNSPVSDSLAPKRRAPACINHVVPGRRWNPPRTSGPLVLRFVVLAHVLRKLRVHDRKVLVRVRGDLLRTGLAADENDTALHHQRCRLLRQGFL